MDRLRRVACRGAVVAAVWILVSSLGAPSLASSNPVPGSERVTKFYLGDASSVGAPVCPAPVGIGAVCFQVPPDWEDSGGGARIVMDDLSGQRVGGIIEVCSGGFCFVTKFCDSWSGSVWPADELRVVLWTQEGCSVDHSAFAGSVTATFFSPPPGSEPPP